MASVALLFAGAVFAALALHPFTTYPLSLRALRRLVSQPPADPITPPRRYAVCLSAYNEEAVIRRKAENLLALRQHLSPLDILVYVDGATDRTAEILREYAPDIQVVVSAQRLGKSVGMNTLIARTAADVIVFTDANAMVVPETIRHLPAYFTDRSVGCVCGHLVYSADVGKSATAQIGAAYWRFEERLKQLETETGSAMGADGALFAIRRELYRPVPADAIDDMFTSLSILCDGHRIVRAPDVIAYEPPTERSGEEFRRKVRIACRAFNAHRLLWPRLRRLDALSLYKYVSHKFLRWLTAFHLALAALAGWLALAAAAAPQVTLLVACGGLGAAAIATRLPIRPLPQLAGVALALLATGLGVVKSLRGERFQTWTPPASTRVTEQRAD